MTSESAGTPEHRGTLGVTAPTTTERQSLVQRAMVLGLLIAVGALAVDMYIPGFAAIRVPMAWADAAQIEANATIARPR
jgi:hypothetical protein